MEFSICSYCSDGEIKEYDLNDQLITQRCMLCDGNGRMYLGGRKAKVKSLHILITEILNKIPKQES